MNNIRRGFLTAFNPAKLKRELLTEIESYEFPDLRDRMIRSGIFKTTGEYDEAFREFKRFVYLIAITKKGLPMSSPQIDKVWHEFILFTKEYNKFTTSIIGKPLRHVPETAMRNNTKNGFRQSDFNTAYIAAFGSIPIIWGINEHINRQQREDKEDTSSADAIPYIPMAYGDTGDSGGDGGGGHSSGGGSGCSGSSCSGGGGCGGGCGGGG